MDPVKRVLVNRGERTRGRFRLGRSRSPLIGTAALAVSGVALGPRVYSSYPAVLPMEPGLSQSTIERAMPFGTVLSSAQTASVRLVSTSGSCRWGVLQAGHGAAMFPVKSVNGGSRWTAAGPLLAADWAGGSIYFVTKVFSVSSSVVVMVSNAVIDLTTDGGRQWFQYVQPGDDWSMTVHTLAGGLSYLSVRPTSYSTLPKGSYALYVFDRASDRWSRTSTAP